MKYSRALSFLVDFDWHCSHRRTEECFILSENILPNNCFRSTQFDCNIFLRPIITISDLFSCSKTLNIIHLLITRKVRRNSSRSKSTYFLSRNNKQSCKLFCFLFNCELQIIQRSCSTRLHLHRTLNALWIKYHIKVVFHEPIDQFSDHRCCLWLPFQQILKQGDFYVTITVWRGPSIHPTPQHRPWSPSPILHLSRIITDLHPNKVVISSNSSTDVNFVLFILRSLTS